MTGRRHRLVRIRKAAGFSQERLAETIGVERSTVMRWERGETCPQPWARPKLARALGLSGRALSELLDESTDKAGVSAPTTPKGFPEVLFDLNKVDLGVSPLEFLSTISTRTPTPSQLGWTDVEHMRATTQALAVSENLFGGGFSCDAAAAQLQWAGRLLEARASDDVRRAMFEAVGNLSGVVAFSAFDIADFVTADQCFQFALWCADQSGSWALRSSTFADMSRQAVFVGKVDDALSLIEFSQVRSDRLSGTTRAMLCALRARLLALLGRHGEASAEVDRADEYFSDRNAYGDPPWMCYYDEAEHQGSTGRALIPVAEADQDLDLVAPRLRAAIQLHAESYPRSRTFSRTRLAALTMKIGDPREAVMIGYQALIDAKSFRSKRVIAELHSLGQVAEQYSRNPDVLNLRHEIANLCDNIRF